MRAIYIENFNADDPAAAVVVGERPEPEPTHGWVVVDVKMAALNHHDVWSARGVGLREEQLPMILGCDAAGTDPDGNEVIVHSVIGTPGFLGDEALDPGLSLLSEKHQGTLAEQVVVPKHNLIPKPAELSWEEAAALPTAWLTAYRMLFHQTDLRPGDTVLVQGSSGGLSTALIQLAAAAGLRVWVTGRSEEKRAFAESLGADLAVEPGTRLPDRVDAVMDSVGAPTWKHSLRSLKKGGTMVVPGGTGGYTGEVEIARLFVMNLRIQGSTMGTKEELDRLVQFLLQTGLRPAIETTLSLADGAEGFRKLAEGDVRGKICVAP